MFIASLAILFAGCNTNELEFDDVQVQPITGTYSLPLGEVTYTMRELIENQDDAELELQEDSTSLLTLLYFDSTSYMTDNDFIEIDDIANNGTVDLTSVPGTPIAGPGNVNLGQSFTFNYEPNGDETIDSVFYESGEVTVNVTTDLPGTLNWTFTINNTVTTVNEIPLELNGIGSSTAVRSLAFHKTLLTETVENTFTVDFDGTLTLGGADIFQGTESLAFDLTYGNQVFSVIWGKFGQDTVQVGNETLDIEFFREMGEEGIFFGNPTLRFNFENTIGIPLGIDFSGLFGDDGMGGNQTFLEGDIVENLPIVEMSPTTNPGELVATTIEINSGNSSIVDLLATSPARLGFDINAISNSEDTTAINFVTQNNQLNASIEIEIPMEVRLEDLQQSGTLSLGADGLDVSDVDSAFLRVVTVNEMPFSGTLVMEMKDADSVTLHTVPEEIVLNAPFIDINGFVTDPNGISADILLSEAGIDALGEASYIELTVTLNTPGSLNSRDIFVKILADYQLEVKIGVGGTVNIDL